MYILWSIYIHAYCKVHDFFTFIYSVFFAHFYAAYDFALMNIRIFLLIYVFILYMYICTYSFTHIYAQRKYVFLACLVSQEKK